MDKGIHVVSNQRIKGPDKMVT